MKFPSFRKAARILFPVLLFVLVNIVFLHALQDKGLPHSFGSDAVYGDLAVASAFHHQDIYGLSEGSPVIPARSALWHALLIALGWLFNDLVSAALLINFVFAILLLFAGLRLARQFMLFQPYLVAALCLLAIYPLTLYASVSGSAQALSMLLVVMALSLHLEGLNDKRMVLPFAAACCVALAMLIRVEFFWVWILFFFHALIMHICRRGDIGLVCVQFFTGLLVCFAFLWPVIDRNMDLVGGPWPAALDAAMALESGELLESTSAAKTLGLGASIGKAYGRMLGGTLGLGLLWLPLLGSFVVLVLSSLKHRADRPLLLLIALPLVLPFCFALSSMVFGWGGVDYLFRAFQPAYLLLLVYGVFRLPFVLEQFGALKGPAGLWVSRGIWAGGLVVLGVAALVKLSAYSKFHLLNLEAHYDIRQDYAQFAKDGDHDQKLVATDLPGWIAFERGSKVLDLTGVRTTDMLTCMGADGGIDETHFVNMLRLRKPELLVIWKDRNQELIDMAKSGLGASVQDLPSYPGGPAVIQLDWSG